MPTKKRPKGSVKRPASRSPLAKKIAPRTQRAVGKHVVITGGTGFLGCHVAELFLRKGWRVTLLDLAALTEPGLIGNVTVVRGDVRDEKLLEKTLKDADVVVHAAAALPLAKPREIRDVTIRGTECVLEAARRLKIPRVVYICSTAVYGVPKKHPILESDPVIGVGAYGQAKIEAEEICLAYRRRGLVIPIIRPKTFIGTGRLGVFQILFDWIRRGARIPVIGSGKNRYQLLAVSDLADAIYLAATKPAAVANDTFNVGAKQFGTTGDDLNALFNVAGTGARLLPTPAAPIKFTLAVLEAMHLSPLYKWVYATADKDSFVSTEKIEQALGWRAKKSNADTLIETYEWYRQHYREYEKATGITHRVAWKQGALALARWVLSPRK